MPGERWAVVTMYRVSRAGEMTVGPYQELERRVYRWKWLARFMRAMHGGKGGAGRIAPGEFAFWRSDIVPVPKGADHAEG